ncbi:hypothetical protein QQ045_012720 [Rhodiola kirilowii]
MTIWCRPPGSWIRQSQEPTYITIAQAAITLNIKHLPSGEKLSSSICTVAVLGVDEAFKTLDQTTIQSFIDAFEIVEEEPAAEQEPATEELAAAPAEGVGQGTDEMLMQQLLWTFDFT